MSISSLVPDQGHLGPFITACGELPGNYWARLHSFNVEKQEMQILLDDLHTAMQMECRSEIYRLEFGPTSSCSAIVADCKAGLESIPGMRNGDSVCLGSGMYAAATFAGFQCAIAPVAISELFLESNVSGVFQSNHIPLCGNHASIFCTVIGLFGKEFSYFGENSKLGYKKGPILIDTQTLWPPNKTPVESTETMDISDTPSQTGAIVSQSPAPPQTAAGSAMSPEQTASPKPSAAFPVMVIAQHGASTLIPSLLHARFGC
jgi:hypothetical protein